jgi:hypothetical protein
LERIDSPLNKNKQKSVEKFQFSIKITLIGRGSFGLTFLNQKSPIIEKATNKYSANTPRFIKTNVS